MTIEEFKTALHKQPFVPFKIRMADGRTFPVDHRDFVARSPSGRTVTVYYDGDRSSVLDLLLMTEIEMTSLDEASPAGDEPR